MAKCTIIPEHQRQDYTVKKHVRCYDHEIKKDEISNNEAKVFRYNTNKREDRKFNTTGEEKNPNNIGYYAKTMEYADKYKNIYDEDGELNYTAKLEEKVIDTKNLFDMEKDFKELKTYRNFIDSQIEIQRRDYTIFLNKAKTAKEKKLWETQIKNLKNREKELTFRLQLTNFQSLSDFHLQNLLVEELKSKGFRGYETKYEFAIFRK